MKQLIKNGKIYDGTGDAPFMGDVLIENDRIVKVGPGISETADKIYDLGGKSISSGFIDAHSHNDWFAIKKDPLPYFAPFLKQGIATFVSGNCGVSAIGFEEGCPYMDVMGAGLFNFQNTTGVYGSLDDFFAAVDRAAERKYNRFIVRIRRKAGNVS